MARTLQATAGAYSFLIVDESIVSLLQHMTYPPTIIKLFILFLFPLHIFRRRIITYAEPL